MPQNAQAYVTRLDQCKPVARRLRAIFNAPDKAEAERLLRQALDAWKTEAPKLAHWAEDHLPEGFTVFDLPHAQRARLRTTNGTHQPRNQAPHPRRLDLP